MKRYHILFAALLSVAAARSEERPDSLQAAPTVEVAEAVGKVGATVVADDEFRRSRQRFLPMRRRIDREIGKVKYAYKGEVMLGLTASYGTITSEDTDFWIIVDNIDAEGTTATVKPFFGYFYRDNNCVGVRFGYNYVHGTLGSIDLELGDTNDI